MRRKVWIFFLFPLAGCAVGAALWFSPLTGWLERGFSTWITEAVSGFGTSLGLEVLEEAFQGGGLTGGGTILLRFFERTEAAVLLQQTLTGLVGGYFIVILIAFSRPAVAWPVGFIVTGALIAAAWFTSFITGAFSGGQIPASAYLSTYLLAGVVRSGQKIKAKRFFFDLFEERIPPRLLARMIRNPRRVDTGVSRCRLSLVSCGAEFPERPAEESGQGEEVPAEGEIPGIAPRANWTAAADTTVAVTFLCNHLSAPILEGGGMIYTAGQRRVDGVFGTPILPGEEAGVTPRAVTAALECIRREGSAARELRIQYGILEPPRFAAGIYTGEATVGYSGKRRLLGYRPLGPEAELSKKLRSLNEEYGTRVLACENTVKALPGDAGARPLDRVRDGRRSFRIYEILNLEEYQRNSEAFTVFNEALSLFEKKRWAEAHRKFLEVLKIRKGDGPSALYAKRCQKYVKTPPAAGWDGTFALPSCRD
jgi:hypothetical protein